MAGKVAIALIKKEAELYRSHGLYKESLRIYAQLLRAVPDKHPEIKRSLQASITRIQKEVQDFNIDIGQPPSAKEMTLMRKGWPEDENPFEIISIAEAFKELGLYIEAINEYHKLWRNPDTSPHSTLEDLTDCLRHLDSDEVIINQMGHILQNSVLDQPNRAAALMKIADLLQQYKRPLAALELFRTVQKLDPTRVGVAQKIKALEKVIDTGTIGRIEPEQGPVRKRGFFSKFFSSNK